MGSVQEGAADSVNAQLQGDGKPCPGCAVLCGEGQGAPPPCGSGFLTFGLARFPALTAHPNPRMCRENSGLVVANVELSEEAQTTNSHWILLEQDPCGPSSLSVSTADCAAVLGHLLHEKWPFFRGTFSLVFIASQDACVTSENRPALKGLLAWLCTGKKGVPEDNHKET